MPHEKPDAWDDAADIALSAWLYDRPQLAKLAAQIPRADLVALVQTAFVVFNEKERARHEADIVTISIDDNSLASRLRLPLAAIKKAVERLGHCRA